MRSLTLYLGRNTFFALYCHVFYFRILGYGLCVDRDMPVLFSERNGYRKVNRFGRWAFQWLRRVL